jgi:hypothetical protein
MSIDDGWDSKLRFLLPTPPRHSLGERREENNECFHSKQVSVLMSEVR